MAQDDKRQEEESVDVESQIDSDETLNSKDSSETKSTADSIEPETRSKQEASKTKFSQTPFSFKQALTPFFIQENAPVTYGLIVVNVALFIVMAATTNGQAIFNPTIEILHNWGANYGPYSLKAEPWRLLTQCFLHIGFLHLLLNMFVLWDLGVLTERVFGSKYFFLLYFLAGLGGSCVSLIVNPAITAAGASGAIFGVAGALIMFCHVKRSKLESIAYSKIREFALILILITSVGGFFYNFDNGAHFGGFFTGALCGIFLAPGAPSILHKLRPLSVIGLSVFVASMFWIARLTPFDNDGMYEIQHGILLLKNRQIDSAMKIADRYIENNPNKSLGYKLKGDVFKRLNINDKAIEFYSEAIKLNPNSGNIYVSRANSYLLNGQPEKAIKDTDKVISSGETRADVNYTRMMALAETGKYKDALVSSRVLLKKQDSRRELYLLDRAKIYQIMGKPSEGLLDLDSVIEKSPSNVRAIENRAYAYYNLGRKKEAEQELSKAEAIKKISDSYGYTSRAYASLSFGRYKQAIIDSKKIVTDFTHEKENIIYGAILGRLASQISSNQESVSFIDSKVSGFGPNNYWPFPIYRYLTGKISEHELLAIAGDNRNKLTEAKAFIALSFEANNQFKKAKEYYSWVVENGNPFYLEYELSKVRLSKLLESNQAPDSISKPSEAKTSDN